MKGNNMIKSSMKNYFCILLLPLLLISFLFGQSNKNMQTPEEYFGFVPGADRMLFDYEKLMDYLKLLDNNSDRIEIEEIGHSPMGKPMYLVVISSEDNIKNLENLKGMNRQLALNPDLAADEMNKILTSGKVFVLGTLSMHSGEVAPSQAFPLIAYDLATTNDPDKIEWLENTVYIVVPNHNPDGMDMIVNHYKKYKGTKYENSSMPGVYHKYVGHDNNRDFVTLTQEDTRAISRIYSLDWFPQVMVEKHQMGSRGPRYFVPPVHDPIAENVEAAVWNWTWIFGSNMVKDMTEKNLAGVVQHYLFDDYWPGSTETCIWKNVIGMLTEGASADYATPIYVEPNELYATGKGLGEYKKSINMPLPWPGGWWHLSDLIQYEIESTYSILKTSSTRHDEILKFRNEVCKNAFEKGKTEAPYYYVITRKQHDLSELVVLINLLKEHGISVYELQKNIVIDGNHLVEGDYIVPLAQPFRPFVKEILEKQKFPARHYTPDGELIEPYDITSWSLPLHLGVNVIAINSFSTDLNADLTELKNPLNLFESDSENNSAVILPANYNSSFMAVFQAMSQGIPVKRISEKATVEKNDIPIGSFIIQEKDADRQKLNSLLEEGKTKPLYLSNIKELKTESLQMPRIALVETYFHDMDAGWTRYIFDTYNIEFDVVHPGEFEKTDFSKKYDIVIFPNNDKSILMEGKWKRSDNTYNVSSYPPEFTRGIGKKGMENLMTFLDEGGKIIAWGRSSELFDGPLSIVHGKDNTEEFQLPFRNIADDMQKKGLYIPGSLVRILLKENHPLTYGMQNEIGVFYRGDPVFTTSLPNFDTDRRVIAVFPEEKILLSGYADNEKVLESKTAMVWLKKGKGQLVLFAFNPQFRASTHVAYKLLFNSILLPKIN
jgi:hypothetical protein